MKISQRQVQALLLAWMAMLAWDFFLHGGLLARFYVTESPFLLDPLQAFQRIPLGYASFFLTGFLLLWLMPRFSLARPSAAFTFGLNVGGAVWGIYVLALLSISTIDLYLALAWLVGQTIEVAIAALVLYTGLEAPSLRRTSLFVFLFLLLSLIVTIMIQNLGYAPATLISP